MEVVCADNSFKTLGGGIAPWPGTEEVISRDLFV